MTYTNETGKKWENENRKTSHIKVSMVHDEEDCEKECTATVPGMRSQGSQGRCAGGEMISGRLDGERPSVRGKEFHDMPFMSARSFSAIFIFGSGCSE